MATRGYATLYFALIIFLTWLYTTRQLHCSTFLQKHIFVLNINITCCFFALGVTHNFRYRVRRVGRAEVGFVFLPMSVNDMIKATTLTSGGNSLSRRTCLSQCSSLQSIVQPITFHFCFVRLDSAGTVGDIGAVDGPRESQGVS